MNRILFVLMCFLLSVVNVSAGMINPLTDVCWSCMFPMTTGGVSWGNGSEPPGKILTPICNCVGTSGVRVGVTASFNEHAWLVESVKTPYYFPALGAELTDTTPGYKGGDAKGGTGQKVRESFQHIHHYVFPVYGMVQIFLDMPCLERNVFDLAYMTEVDDMWSDDLLALLINPEAIAFGNPVTQMSCITDAVAASAGYPLDSLFWCLGAWGSSYPLTGTTAIGDPVTSSAATSARMLFKLGREGALWDTGINECSDRGVLTPFMIKSNYKFQIARPVVGNQCVPIGRTAHLWGSGKNPIVGGSGKTDEFLYVVTRRRVCCIAYNLAE